MEVLESRDSSNGMKAPAFKDQEFWNEFFQNRQGLPFEWYAEWPDLSRMLARHCGLVLSRDSTPKILVPGCGNSEISAAMYDAGFTDITNIDFCQAVIAEMLRKHLRQRPRMLWKVMDMTKMQFPDCSFDCVLDKGGLDALLGEPDEDPSLGMRFLSEVKRVLKPQGKYACITLAQNHVIGLLMSTFRHGWQLGVYGVPLVSEDPSPLKPFLVVASKGSTDDVSLITSELCGGEAIQVENLCRLLEAENLSRKDNCFETVDVDTCTFEKLYPNRRITMTLGAKGKSKSTYKAIVMDAKEDLDAVTYACAVFLVPKGKAQEWLYASEEGQWQVVESAKAARLIMVFVDARLGPRNNEDIQDDLSPLVRDLIPSHSINGANVPFLMPADGVRERRVVEEVNSPLTGTMIVEDVALSSEKIPNQEFFRRLVFKRNPNLIQSEALLMHTTHRRIGGKKKNKSSKETASHRRQNSTDEMKVDHSYLASPYHEGMIAGLSLIASNIEHWISTKEMIRVMVVGLGAGLLPMFLYNHLPFDRIQVVELDDVVGVLAKRHFGFVEDEKMKLYVGNGVAAVKAIAKNDVKDLLHVLIIDADSSDPSNGLSCPPMEFLEADFFKNARAAMQPRGILIINVVSRARQPHVEANTRLCEVFEEVYSLQVDEDVNRVVFALSEKSREDVLTNGSNLLKKIGCQYAQWGKGPNIKEIVKSLKRLK